MNHMEKQRKTYENLCDTYENQWKPMNTYEALWNTLKHMETYENVCKTYVGPMENQWKPYNVCKCM